MEALMKGDIVAVEFPFTNLEDIKKRPALIAAKAGDNDFIVSRITTVKHNDGYEVEIDNGDIEGGTLKTKSRARTNKLFTADASIIHYKIGALKQSKIKEVENKIISLFSN